MWTSCLMFLHWFLTPSQSVLLRAVTIFTLYMITCYHLSKVPLQLHDANWAISIHCSLWGAVFTFTVKTVRCSCKLKRTNMWALLHALFSKVKNKLPLSNIYPHLHNQNKLHIFIWPLHGNTLRSLLQDPARLSDLICVARQSADPKGPTEATVILTTILCWLQTQDFIWTVDSHSVNFDHTFTLIK